MIIQSLQFSAIEIYNKPRISYRDECFVILLINAWELILKAILSRNRQRIYYPKKYGKPYRTLSLGDALAISRVYFPANIDYEPVAKNIELLTTYRDNAIHFYNRPRFGELVHGLSQTSLKNYRDLVLALFRRDIATEMTIALLPLSFGRPPDPIEFIREYKQETVRDKPVLDFLRRISEITKELEANNLDTARLLTVFHVSLQSVKKVASADLIVGIDGTLGSQGTPYVVEKRVDPNRTHPLRRKDVLERVEYVVDDVKFTSHIFQAVVWHYQIQDKGHLCWRAAGGQLTLYSNDMVGWIKNLTRPQIDEALEQYRIHLQKRRQRSNVARP